MPFRVPHDYRSQSLFIGVASRDPSADEATAYLVWLRREVALAEEYLRPHTAESQPRAPLDTRKAQLIKFLAGNGPSTRIQILAGTDIPPGSLSALLKGSEFFQSGRGRWTLKEPA